MSIIRKRSASHKAIIPGNARDNQYILAEFNITEQMVARFQSTDNGKSLPYMDFYQHLSQLFFALCEQLDVPNSQFIANDKLARVRFSQEMHQWQTNQQILFYYDPSQHVLQKAFYDANKLSKKVSLLFLATGLDIRLNAALMHARVNKIVELFTTEIGVPCTDLRIRDHQHLTYDIFARHKGIENTQSHKLRPIPLRYEHQGMALKSIDISAMTYAVVNVPVTNHLLNLVEVDPDSADPYNPLYTFVTDAFTQSAKRYNLNNGALIANGLIPVIRFSEHEATSVSGELQMLGYNPNKSPCGLLSKWNATELIDAIQLIFVATSDNVTEYGYGKFLNQVEQAVKLFTTELEILPNKEQVIVRFHQHIAYNK